MEANLRIGHPYVVKVEHELIPKTILGWGLCLPSAFFTIWKTKKEGEYRLECKDVRPENAKLILKAEDLPDNLARGMLEAVKLASFGDTIIAVESTQQLK